MGSSGNIETETASTYVSFADGNLTFNGNRRPCFTFDTTLNKRFELSNTMNVYVSCYDADGNAIVLTTDNMDSYVESNAKSTNINVNYGNGAAAYLLNVTEFSVSDEIKRIILVLVTSPISSLDIRTEYPCPPIRNDILTLSALPTNGYIGAKVIYSGALYMYNGSEWSAV